MKKVFLFLMVVLATSCGKNDTEPKSHQVLVNVFYSYEAGGNEEIASPSLVMLYKEKAAEFDFDESVSSMANDQKMTLKDGQFATPVHISDSFSGINIINDVETGNYTLIVFYKPEGYSWPMFYYYGYKEISVTDLTTNKIVFMWNEESGKFVKK